MEDKVKNLQDNLKVLRMAAGLTTTELGKHLGVTRQTINNLERHRNDMTMMQYYAISHVFEEIRDRDWNTMIDSDLINVYPDSVLTRVYPILIKAPELFTNEYKEYVKKGVLMYTPAYFSHFASMEEIYENFEDYLHRFDGEREAR